MNYPFRNLVFEGGGVKGIAYVGAMDELESKGIMPQIKRVGGTSAGAINAMMLGLGYTNKEVRDILFALNFNKFLDDSWGLLRDSERLIKEYGWYKGDFFREWVAERIWAKTGNSETTFKEAFDQKDKKGFKDMYFVGANVSTHFAEVFSYEHTPRMPIADAVRISMSIPLFFKAQKSLRGDVYVDGGLLDNYPVKLFDRQKYVDIANFSKHTMDTAYYKAHNEALKNEGKFLSNYIYNKETLGFRLDSAKEIAVFRDQAEPPVNKINDFFDYASNLVKTILDAQSNQHLHNDDWHRTIYIDTLGVGTTDFSLKDQTKRDLVKSGRDHARKYFDWYDNPSHKTPALNRPLN
ncbi:MAG: patatin-like phospholipase family protein [Deltaproteobacteria bacterium]